MTINVYSWVFPHGHTGRREEREKSSLKRICQVGLFAFMFVSYGLKFNDS